MPGVPLRTGGGVHLRRAPDRHPEQHQHPLRATTTPSGDVPRPGHADYTASVKYGESRGRAGAAGTSPAG